MLRTPPYPPLTLRGGNLRRRLICQKSYQKDEKRLDKPRMAEDILSRGGVSALVGWGAAFLLR